MTSCSKLNVARPSTTDRVLPIRSRSRSRFSTQATPSSTLKESPYELAEYCVKQTRIHLFFSNLDPLRGLWELALAYPLYLLKPEPNRLHNALPAYSLPFIRTPSPPHLPYEHPTPDATSFSAQKQSSPKPRSRRSGGMNCVWGANLRGVGRELGPWG